MELPDIAVLLREDQLVDVLGCVHPEGPLGDIRRQLVGLLGSTQVGRDGFVVDKLKVQATEGFEVGGVEQNKVELGDGHGNGGLSARIRRQGAPVDQALAGLLGPEDEISMVDALPREPREIGCHALQFSLEVL